MRFWSFVFAAFAGIAAARDLTRCGTTEPDDALKAELHAAYISRPANVTAPKPHTVDTYVHVVTSQEKRGSYTQSMIDEQMKVMNTAYAPLGVTFNTISVNFTINAAWAAAAMSSPEELDMKTSLRQGTYADLNLYFTSDLPDGLLGFCYFPLARPSSTDTLLDGCTCLADSLPSGSAENYNLGYTAVHETGHWFGLYHVFQGSSCSGSGDYVADTPPQKTATSGCPVRAQDSCPDQQGVDSVHNYMDYGFDSCMEEFTPGQVRRALSIFDRQRAGK